MKKFAMVSIAIILLLSSDNTLPSSKFSKVGIDPEEDDNTFNIRKMKV